MNTFKQFIESGIGGGFGFGQSYESPFGKSGKQLHSNQPYMTTHALTRKYDALMGPRRRQLLDDEVPGQKYQYYIILIRNLIADVDTGRLIAGQAKDPYKVVYTQGEMTKQGYNPEEQTKIAGLNVFAWTNGYGHRDLVRKIGENNLDKIALFRTGNLFDPNSDNSFIMKQGYFVNIDQLSAMRDKFDKLISTQDTLERGTQYLGNTVGAALKRGAALNRIPDSPSTKMT